MSDFGLSRIGIPQSTIDQDQVFLAKYAANLGDDTLHQHCQGSYSAPRGGVHDVAGDWYRKADLWSLGCILAELLAFTVNGAGAAGVKEFRTRRLDDDPLNRSDTFHLSRANQKSVLEQSVSDYLQSFEQSWSRRVSAIISDSLKIDAQQRPWAHQVVTLLDDALKYLSLPEQSLTPQRSVHEQSAAVEPAAPSTPDIRLSFPSTRINATLSASPRTPDPGRISDRISDWDRNTINLTDYLLTSERRSRPNISTTAVNGEGSSIALLVDKAVIQIVRLNITLARPDLLINPIELGKYKYWTGLVFVGCFLCVWGTRDGIHIRIFDIDGENLNITQLPFPRFDVSNNTSLDSLRHVAITATGNRISLWQYHLPG